MKFRSLILTAISLLAAGALLMLSGCGGGGEAGFSTEQLNSMEGARLEQNLKKYFSSGNLPAGEEKTFLVWAFQKDNALAEKYVREYANEIANLPWYLADGAWDLVRQQDFENGLKMLGIARELYPNNPDVLGITGIIAYLRGDRDSARKFLEEAESWRSNRPIVDFYFGGLLVMSESAADRTRGKSLLMGLVSGSDAELRELSGLTLLSNVNVPMIREDIDTIYTTLESNDVFRLGNPNLPAEAVRIGINRLVPYFPDRAMQLADLLMQYPNKNVEDLIGIIRLAQAMGDKDKARTHINELQGDQKYLDTLEDAKRLDRIIAVQSFMEENYEEGMEQLRACTTDPDLVVSTIQQTFQNIMRNKLPLSTEGSVLQLYLEMPVNNITTSLGVLTRLIQIEPLKKADYIAYSIEKLLPQDPVRVGSWLVQVDASESVVSAIGNKLSLTSDEAMVLINAFIALQDNAKAQATLDKSKALIEPVIASYFQAQIFAQEGKKKEAIEFWEEAHQGVVGSNRFPLLKNLGILALQLDQPVNAMQSLYTALTAGIPFTQAQAGKLIELTMQYGNLRQAIQVAEYMEETFADEDLHKNNLAYFKFLAEEQVEESVEIMRKLVEEYPDIPQYQLTLALGLVKAGRTNEASRLVKSMNIDWEKTSTRGQMIYAVVLAASDERTLAQGLLQNIDQSILIPEEKALLEAF